MQYFRWEKLNVGLSVTQTGTGTGHTDGEGGRLVSALLKVPRVCLHRFISPLLCSSFSHFASHDS